MYICAYMNGESGEAGKRRGWIYLQIAGYCRKLQLLKNEHFLKLSNYPNESSCKQLLKVSSGHFYFIIRVVLASKSLQVQSNGVLPYYISTDVARHTQCKFKVLLMLFNTFEYISLKYLHQNQNLMKLLIICLQPSSSSI